MIEVVVVVVVVVAVVVFKFSRREAILCLILSIFSFLLFSFVPPCHASTRFLPAVRITNSSPSYLVFLILLLVLFLVFVLVLVIGVVLALFLSSLPP